MSLLYCLIALYILFEFMLMFETGELFPLLRHAIKKLLRFLLKNKACKIGIHTYRYKEETHQVTGVPHFKKTNIHIRYCEKCGIRWISFYSPGSNMFHKWERRDHIEEDTVLKMKMNKP